MYPVIRNDINISQHGFMQKRPTSTSLLELYTDVSCFLDKGQQFDTIFLDFSKAFDSVPHNLLLKKPCTFSVNGSFLKWFQEYLHNRKQCVLFQGHHSGFKNVVSCVPQGSILGPLLFIMYINDISTTDDTIVSTYADVTKIVV